MTSTASSGKLRSWFSSNNQNDMLSGHVEKLVRKRRFNAPSTALGHSLVAEGTPLALADLGNQKISIRHASKIEHLHN